MTALLFRKELGSILASMTATYTGKKKGGRGMKIFLLVLMVYLVLSLAFLSGGMGYTMAPLFSLAGLDSFYFSFASIASLMMGIMGDVFTTYSILYKAKDNEFLLSLPLKSSEIVGSKMGVVYMFALAYESVVFIPFTVAWWLTVGREAGGVAAAVVSQILLWLSISLLCTAFTCLLGYVVALLTKRLGRFRNAAVIILSFSFLALYFALFSRFTGSLEDLAGTVLAAAESVKSSRSPLYLAGAAVTGRTGLAVVIFLFSLALLLLVSRIVSATYISTALSTPGGGRKSGGELKIGKAKGVESALMGKEISRFLSLPVYTLNAGLGIVIMPVAAVFLILRRNSIAEALSSFAASMPFLSSFLLPSLSFSVSLLVSTDCGTAPSISLEGKEIWILQSLPLDGGKVLEAKCRTFFLLNVVPALLFASSAALVFALPPLSFVLILIHTVLFTYFSSAFGIWTGMASVNLHWTNPAVPVKQSVSVTVALFGGMGAALVLSGAAIGLAMVLPVEVAYSIVLLLLGALDVTLTLWMRGKGGRKFTYLS